MEKPVLLVNEIFEQGANLFGSCEAFGRWLEKPSYGLGGQIPSALLKTPEGLESIQNELIRIEYGDLA